MAVPASTTVTAAAPPRTARGLPVVLAAAAIGSQILYPLLDGDALRNVTIAAVLFFCAASVTHAAVHHGTRYALTLLLVAGGIGLLAESVGVATGWPFGRYSYAGTLGPQLFGVPVVVPLAWTMMAYPCLLLGRRLMGRRHRWAPLPAAAALASWDVFLDPQMVAAGHWTWTFPEPALPGIDGIPLTNFAGWVLVALVMTTALHLLLPTRTRGGAPDERVPAALLAWTWLGSSLAAVAFFERPGVAAWGLPLMGLTVAPYLALALRDRRQEGLR